MALMPVDEAKALVLAGVRPLAGEKVRLKDAFGRILALDLHARRDQPPFAVSAMDGYAIHSKGVSAGAQFQLIGTAAAGHPFRGKIGKGQAVRIFTGAVVPVGANAILIQENASVEAGSITATAAVEAGQYVRPRGLDFSRGQLLLKAGQRLSSRDVGLAAAMNHASLPLRRRPTTAILGTGDELMSPGQRLRADQIVGSNNPALATFVRWAGGVALDFGIVPDDRRRIRAAIRRASAADILVITGGASVGEHDLVKASLEAEGIQLAFWKIAMRPGKPLMFARSGRQRILGLPGNPVSSLICARIFLKPLIDRFLGNSAPDIPLKAALGLPMRANDQRQEYARARLDHGKDGGLIATPYPAQDSSMLRLLADADCLIIRPPFAEAASAGTEVPVLPLDF
ncbi:MAG: molybdopterin molybdotransferase MoeA [Aestuariivirgaceae bacterium]